ncbi:hypothetical protein [Thalassobellus sediminis]|uniref:hypothetical protein n=1 Tax=Thalassobellus sediminis TaxID=3367753 RepID=UPI00379C2961
MSKEFYGFDKFCELLNDSNILKRHSVAGIIKMLQLCISEIKSDVLLKLSNEGQNDYYLGYLIHEIDKQDYLKDFGIEKIQHVLDNLNVTVDDLINTTYPYELNDVIDVKLSWEEYYENFDYLRSIQENLLLYFLNFYANELKVFLESLKSTNNQKELQVVNDSKKKEQETKNVFGSISFKFEKVKTADDFYQMHKETPFFKEPLAKNSNFLKELFEFLSDENRPVKTTYEIFDKKLNLYLINGYSLFYMRFPNAESVVIYPASLKMKYLEDLKKRKRNLRIYNLEELNKIIKQTYELRDLYTEKFSEFFNYDEKIKKNADIYSAILLQAVRELLKTAIPYFKDYTPDQILGFNDNRLNIAKSEIKYSFQTFHNLIRHIGLNHTPYLEHKAVEFISGQINIVNKNIFEFSYLYEVLESESNKIYNDKVYEKIIEKNKLLETHKYYESGNEESKKSTPKFRNDIFISVESQNWFNDALQELAAIDNKNKPERSFQAISNAIFRDENCKSLIFKNRLSLKKYIQFLNDEYKAEIKNETNLSNHQNYIEDVKDLIKISQNNLSTNKSE